MKNVVAMLKSARLVVVLIALMTILSEISSGFKGFLKGLFGHHWVSKGILSILIFFLAYYYLSDKEGNPEKEARSLFWTSIISVIVVFLFYVWEFFE